MPEDMSFDDGAALGISYTTAFMLIFDVANIKPGKSVLVHSAGGGVVSDVLSIIIQTTNVYECNGTNIFMR